MTTRKRAGASARAGARKRAPQKTRRSRRVAPKAKPKSKSKLKPKPKLNPKPRSSPAGRLPKFYTAEFLAEAQRRIEQTSQSMTAIAGELGLHHSVLSRLIAREGWVRPDDAGRRRGLSPLMRLAAAADELVAAHAEAPPTPIPTLPLAEGGSEIARAVGASPQAGSTADTAAIARLEAAVLKELSVVEAMRASLGAEPLRPMDAERTARTLSVLTETLAKLRRLRVASASPAGRKDHDDDIPADIDEFRHALARRIELFVASRRDAGRDGGHPPAVVDGSAP